MAFRSLLVILAILSVAAYPTMLEAKLSKLEQQVKQLESVKESRRDVISDYDLITHETRPSNAVSTDASPPPLSSPAWSMKPEGNETIGWSMKPEDWTTAGFKQCSFAVAGLMSQAEADEMTVSQLVKQDEEAKAVYDQAVLDSKCAAHCNCCCVYDSDKCPELPNFGLGPDKIMELLRGPHPRLALCGPMAPAPPPPAYI